METAVSKLHEITIEINQILDSIFESLNIT